MLRPTGARRGLRMWDSVPLPSLRRRPPLVLPDEIEIRVAQAVALVRAGPHADMGAAYRLLEPLILSDVVAEAFLIVEDATRGVDLDVLLAAATVPFPPNPVDLVAAVWDKDLHAFMAATDKHTPDRMLSTLLMLAASLTDARKRI